MTLKQFGGIKAGVLNEYGAGIILFRNASVHGVDLLLALKSVEGKWNL